MTFTYETRTTKVTYETKAESLERGYDYGGGILDDFADFLRGCGFPLERDETITVYDPEKELIVEREEFDGMREDLIELEVLREGKTEAKTTDGWIEWNGGPCPVSRDTRVKVRFRDEYTIHAVAGDMRWDHDSTTGDIVAYRVLEEA